MTSKLTNDRVDYWLRVISEQHGPTSTIRFREELKSALLELQALRLENRPSDAARRGLRLFAIGDRVWHTSESRSAHGTVTGIYTDESYCVHWDSGEIHVAKNDDLQIVMRPPRPSLFMIGDRVRACYLGANTVELGTVLTIDHGDRYPYRIQYDSGQIINHSRDNIRAVTITEEIAYLRRRVAKLEK